MRDIYQPYLDHFKTAVSIRSLATAVGSDNLIGLRHDVDYCIDTALKMAWIEHEMGIRSSYYILHTAKYMTDPELFSKCRQIESFGHEVGLHTNFLANWFKGNGIHPAIELEQTLEKFRNEGLTIVGVAAHGDVACYSGQFTNYWLFSDFRQVDGELETDILAEGVKAPCDRPRTISATAGRSELVRKNGDIFKLWSLKLNDFGIDYEASKIKSDQYFSDSGGNWIDLNPLSMDLSVGQYQVLIHPWHWRGQQKHTYFLGPARSGTKWISQLLENAGTPIAEHEVTLNYQPTERMLNEKNTGVRIADFLAAPNEIKDHVADARDRSEAFENDYAEANIYLAEVLDYIPHGLDTNFVHIMRNPKDVVRSLWQRDWYNVSFDSKHPTMDVPNWDKLTQFEQICWYVRRTHEKIIQVCDASISFEKMVTDQSYLSEELSKLEIGLYPLLAEKYFYQQENQTEHWTVLEYEFWSAENKFSFSEILGPICRALGYEHDGVCKPSRKKHSPIPTKPEVLVSALPAIGEGPLSFRNVVVEDGCFSFQPHVNAVVLLGGGFWKRENFSVSVSQSLNLAQELVTGLWPAVGGWAAEPLHFYSINIEAELVSSSVRLICISYDGHGNIIRQTDIGRLTNETPQILCHFKPARRSKYFNLALYVSSPKKAVLLKLKTTRIAKTKENRQNSKRPDEIIKLANPTRNDKPWTQVKLPAEWQSQSVSQWNTILSRTQTGFKIAAINPTKPNLFVFSGGQWNNLYRSAILDCEPTTISMSNNTKGFAGLVHGSVENAEDNVGVFLMNYSKGGALEYSVRVGNLGGLQKMVPFSLANSENSRGHWSIGLHAPPHCKWELYLTD